MNNKCSTCLKNNTNKLTRITELDYDGISYLDKLRIFLGLDLALETSNDLKMCQNCVKNLCSSYNFRKIMLDSLQTKQDNLYSENQINMMDNSNTQEQTVDSQHDTIKIEYNNEDFMQLIQPKKVTEHKTNKPKIPTKATKTQKSFTCKYCRNVFKTSCQLKEHLTSHASNKDYSCCFCQKSFPRLSSLKRHMKSHYAPPGQKTRKTPFLCTICGKEFPFSNGAARHMRIHFNVRLHECLVCNKKFSQSTHLLVHMRTHSGEKPYVCENCGEKFTLKAGLHKHLKKHHKDTDEFLGVGVAKNFCGSNIDVYFK